MMTIPSMRSVGTALVMAMLAAAPTAALAQSTQPAGAGCIGPAGRKSGRRADARRGRIKELQRQLRITPAQEPQWNAFAQVMRSNAREMGEAAKHRAEQFATMDAVQNMQSYEQLAEAHVQRLQKLLPAFEALYNTMSPPQKKLADETFRRTAEKHSKAHS